MGNAVEDKTHPPILLSLSALTDAGRVRKNNEDSFLLANFDRETAGLKELACHTVGPKGSLLAVSDGMGWAEGGELASRSTEGAVFQWLSENWGRKPLVTSLGAALERSIHMANETVLRKARENPKLFGMGATILLAGIVGDRLYLRWVGDNRCYLFRNNAMARLSEDPSLPAPVQD